MKTLRKYANMALLLVSVATIVPAYAVEPQKTETVIWYKDPEVHDKVGTTVVILLIGAVYFGLVSLKMYYKPGKPGIWRK